MSRRASTWLAIAGLTASCALIPATQAKTFDDTTHALAKAATPQLTKSIDNTSLARVPGSVPRQALAKYDQGALPASQPINNITLVLKRSDDREKAFRSYLHDLNNPASPNFHHWLTEEQIGKMFGPAPEDVSKVTQWLSSQGLKVTKATPDRMMVFFSGTPAALNKAFHTSLHKYTVDGEVHFANSSEQQIPAALTPVVKGVASLHNFFPKPQHTAIGKLALDRKTGKWGAATSKVAPQFTVPPGTVDPNITYDMVPADFNEVYNVNGLWGRGTPIRGAGQTVAVLERTNVQPQDVANFRKAFLPADATGVVAYVHPGDGQGDVCADPGINGDEGEAALDAEWAGAAAPDANILLASCADNVTALGATFGPFTAAAELLGGTGQGGLPAPTIWSLSYGSCEMADEGDASLADIFWSEAAAEGVTVFVSTGDGGSTQCDQGGLFASQGGAEVNGMAASTSAVAVGGTDFNDRDHIADYWTSSNLPMFQSAISYIPEMAWNNSCASSHLYTLLGYKDGVTACNDSVGRGQDFLQIGGGGGGASTLFAQPESQVGIYGSFNHTSRTLPDISLFSANGIFSHALVFCMSDTNEGGVACDFSNPDNVFANSAGGTSFAAPALAGVQALVNQVAGERSGNMLPAIYTIAAREFGTVGSPNAKEVTDCNSTNGVGVGSACVFNNVTEGDIVQPCWAGSVNCDSGRNLGNSFGIVDGGNPTTQKLVPAWKTNPGYSLATGLGSINAANFADAVAAYGAPFKRGYTVPYDFLSLGNIFTNDGYSDVITVDPVKGQLRSIAMKGAVELYEVTQPVDVGASVGAVGDFVPGLDVLSLKSGEVVLVEPDNRLHVWVSTANGGFFPFTVSNPVPTTWKLIGGGVNDASGNQKLLFFDTQSSQLYWWTLDLDQTTLNDIIVTNVSAPVGGIEGATPTLADANGDGYSDIVWTTSSDNSVNLWISDQQGGFVTHRLADHPAGFSLFGTADVNGDGTTDLIWSNTATSQVSWWTLSGFKVVAQKSKAVPAGLTLASIADYDGDGVADLLFQNANGKLVDWQGTGTNFQSTKVADAYGKAVVVPAGQVVQAGRIQGSRRLASPSNTSASL